MKKIKLYIAISLDGYIAKADGSVDWLHELPNPDKLDYGYFAFYDSVDTTLMGNKTYQQVLGFDMDFPYADKTNYVFTQNTELKDDGHAKYISKDHINFLKELKKGEGKDIWLIGGGQLNALLLHHRLIDEMQVYIMPILLGDGIPMFAKGKESIPLNLVHTETYSSGVVELRYG